MLPGCQQHLRLVAALIAALGGTIQQARAATCTRLPIPGLSGESHLQGSKGFVSGDKLTLQHNAGTSIASGCSGGSVEAQNIAQFHLLGKTLSYEVDLSKVGCACNLAVYLVSAPAKDWNGNPSRGDWGDYYCDANEVGGQWCPEIDIQEANNAVFQATPHKCDAPNSGGHYSNCDRGGCGQNTKDTPGKYGPGPDNKIDTTRPFTVSTTFEAPAATFTGMRTVLSQGDDRQIVLDHSNCDAGYLAQLSDALRKGMSLRITYWGDSAQTMSWMDQPPCGTTETCQGDNAGEGVITGLRVTDAEAAGSGSGGSSSSGGGGHTTEQEHICKPLPVSGMDGRTYFQGSRVLVSDDRVTVMHNSAGNIATGCGEGDVQAEDIGQLKLLGGSLRFTVDLSKVGCACNLAVYLVSAPARSAGGDFRRGDWGNFYCDANKVGGQYCPEIDIMEANNRVLASTPHKCDPPVNGQHYTSCDAVGCGQNTKDKHGYYGPGPTYRIDTTHPFNVTTSFQENSGTLTGMVTTLEQHRRMVVLDHSNCDPWYLTHLSHALAAGMSLRFSYWGSSADGMAWLDEGPCGSDTCAGSNAGPAVVSNIRLYKTATLPTTTHATTANVMTTPPPVPTTTAAAPAPAPAPHGPICSAMPVIGQGERTYIQGNKVSVSGDRLTLEHNSGSNIARGCSDGPVKAENIAQLKLLGRTISYEVDLSKVGCACNLAFYLVSAPARDVSGNPTRGQWKDFYCDANKVGGQWCPEIDIMEANTHTFAATPHKCDAPVNGKHYNNCDRGGCGQNTKDQSSSYGPGSGNRIDTTKPFNVTTSFKENSGSFAGMLTILEQQGRKTVLDHSNCQPWYNSQLSDALRAGMSLRITYWGDSAQTMAWLDQPPCGTETCSGSNTGPGVISSIRISGTSPSPGPPPPPTASPTPPPPPAPATSVTSAPAPAPSPVPDGTFCLPLPVRGLGGNPHVQGKGAGISGDRLTLEHNAGTSIASGCSGGDVQAGNIAQFKLLGKSIGYTVDLSRVGCACNLAVYLVSAPAKDLSGNPTRGQWRDFYCDANKVGGQWCPEIDIMEANNRVLQATPHKCDPPANGFHYNNCDRGGCVQNTRDTAGSYGPGTSNKINTDRAFNVTTTFSARGADLVGMTTVLKQGSSQVVLDHSNCDPSYYAALSKPVADGMSLRITYWGDSAQTMSWMDIPPCGPETCQGSNAGQGTITGIWVAEAKEDAQVTVPQASSGSSWTPALTPSASPPSPTPAPTPSWTPSPTPAPPPAERYNCFDAGPSSWEDKWQSSKRTWCCKRHYLGCSKDKIVTGTSTGSQVGPIRWPNHVKKCLTVSGGSPKLVLWDCDGEHGDSKQRFKAAGDGKLRWAENPDMCVTVRNQVADNGADIDLDRCASSASYQTFIFPSSDMKIRWADHPSLCLDVTGHKTRNGNPIQLWECLSDDDDQVFTWMSMQPPSTTTEVQATTIKVTTTTTEPAPRFNCKHAWWDWAMKWSDEKATWCCVRKGVGCRVTTTSAPALVPTATSAPFDCTAGYSNWEWGWSSGKKEYCCRTKQLGCTTTAAPAPSSVPAGYDCTVWYPNAEREWTAAQKQWCCATKMLGCGATSTSERYDCTAWWPAVGWSLDKTSWCCRHKQIGCQVATTTKPDDVMYYDCRFGYGQWEKLWSLSQMDWCCKHEGRGCAATTTGVAAPAVQGYLGVASTPTMLHTPMTWGTFSQQYETSHSIGWGGRHLELVRIPAVCLAVAGVVAAAMLAVALRRRPRAATQVGAADARSSYSGVPELDRTPSPQRRRAAPHSGPRGATSED